MASPPRRPPPKTILLLEDNSDFSAAISNFLDDEDERQYKVISFDNADHALERAKSSDEIHLFIVDLKLPSATSGYEFLRLVQEHGLFPRAPKLIISDLAKERVFLSGRPIPIEELARVGMSDFIEKRVFWERGPEQFVSLVNSLIDANAGKATVVEDRTASAFLAFRSGIYLAGFGAVTSALGSLFERASVIIAPSVAAFAAGTILVAVSVQLGRREHQA